MRNQFLDICRYKVHLSVVLSVVPFEELVFGLMYRWITIIQILFFPFFWPSWLSDDGNVVSTPWWVDWFDRCLLLSMRLIWWLFMGSYFNFLLVNIDTVFCLLRNDYALLDDNLQNCDKLHFLITEINQPLSHLLKVFLDDNKSQWGNRVFRYLTPWSLYQFCSIL